MATKVDELALRVEAILFAGGKPLAVHEIATALGTEDSRAIQAALKTLGKTYAGRQTALELRRVGDRYALQLQEPFVAVARVVTPMEMSARTVKALTLVAYHQPMLQSLLARMFGEAAYEEVQRLRGMGLLHTEPKGATLELTTTRAFAEYFGIGSTKPEEIRKFLEGKLGATPAAPAAGFPAPESAAATEPAAPAPEETPPELAPVEPPTP